MIALCRAKCWIIQLRNDEVSSATIQCGIRGHIIVYSQHPSAIACTLPSSLDDVLIPICVIFVGSKPPTAEWLQKKARPLIVQQERVMNALIWLQKNHHLYKDVVISGKVFEDQPTEFVPPFHIQHIVLNTALDATTSDYVPAIDTHIPLDPLDLSDITCPPISDLPFQSVVGADVDPHAPSHTLRSAALKHMQCPGSNYIETPHDPLPVNEFRNLDLFPMMYPALFPYGIGKSENLNRQTRFSFKSHIKHLLSLSDCRFQEHSLFLPIHCL
ncbi:hypothetical protein DFH07DRAFT_759635 [Mycena maculata]|uniref:DUF6570 domain-containing protein n=1 Tax=Mycena maculata TaxID=230809 RepID=A0AAD7MM82_9AGAR|nr:hypothetical protein DFH07DRAFT_759635 [Mycena maculata]